MTHPTYRDFHPVHHPSYIDFFEQVLADTTDPVEIEKKYEKRMADRKRKAADDKERKRIADAKAARLEREKPEHDPLKGMRVHCWDPVQRWRGDRASIELINYSN